MAGQPPNDPAQPPELPPALDPSASAPTPPPPDGAFGEISALLRNRLILLGLGVIVVLLLITVVLVVIDAGGGAGTPSGAIGPNTPVSDATVVPLQGLPGHMRSTATLWNGPGDTYAILGTVAKNATVSVIGRNAGGSWLQVVPPHSVRGWIDATFIDVQGDVSRLPIGGPGSGPDVAVPTSVVFNTPVRVPTKPQELPTEPQATPTESAKLATTTPIFAPTNTPPLASTPTPVD